MFPRRLLIRFRSVPPHPISMSSQCDPKHNILRGDLFGSTNSWIMAIHGQKSKQPFSQKVREERKETNENAIISEPFFSFVASPVSSVVNDWIAHEIKHHSLASSGTN